MKKLKRIAIHSVPRSGSTWLGSIFDSHPNVIYKLQPLFSYAFKDRLSPTSTKNEIDDFFKELATLKDDFLDQKDGKDKRIIPEFIKEAPTTIVYKEVRYHYILKNLLEQDHEINIIGLNRNPLSVIYSWWKAPKEFRAEQGWKIEEEWRFAPKKNLDKLEEFNGYEKWKEATLLFNRLKKEYPDRFFLVNYDDLLQDTTGTVTNLFDFAGLEVSDQTLQFIEKSRNTSVDDAYGVFKKKEKDDGWKGKLPTTIIEAIKSDPDFVKLNKKYNWI